MAEKIKMKQRLLDDYDHDTVGRTGTDKAHLEDGHLRQMVANTQSYGKSSLHGSNNSAASVLTQVYEASVRGDRLVQADHSINASNSASATFKSYASKSFGLNYLFAVDDPEALIPSNENIFPRHVHNSPVLTVFLLLNTMIGSGILNQPQVFLDAGIIPATIMLAVSAFFTWLGLVALIDVGAQFEKFDFSELSLHAFGKSGEVLVDISIAIGNFGSLLSYILVIGSTSAQLLSSWGCNGNNVMCSETALTIVIVALCVTPVCLKRVFGELAIYSVISMISIGSIVMLTMVGGPFVGHSGHEPVALYKTGGMLNKMGSIVFALSCSFAAFHTYVSLEDASAARWRIITAWTMLFGFLMLFAIGVGKLFKLMSDVQTLIFMPNCCSWVPCFP
jgi:hypothetical protein